MAGTDTNKKPKCKFWDKCFRINAAHRKQFRHPDDDDDNDEEDDKKGTTPMKKTTESTPAKADSSKKAEKRKQESDSEKEDMDTGPLVTMGGSAAKRKAHTMSQSDDEDSSATPAKKIKTDASEAVKPSKVKTDTDEETKSPKAAKANDKEDEPMPSSSKVTKRRMKCKYWDKCYRKEANHIKQFIHPSDPDAADAVDEDEGIKTRGQTKKPLNAMDVGDVVDFDSCRIKRTGDGYSCTCPAWKNQKKAPDQRTCKHLKEYLGSEFEKHRTGEDKPKPKQNYIKSHISVSLLLAHKYDEKVNDPTGWWMSEKLDGVRAFWNGRCFYSRLGNAFIAPEWFTKDLPTDIHMDGELFGGRGKFQSTVSIVKTPEDDRWKSIKYHVFDAPNLEKESFESRIQQLQEYFDENNPKYALLVEQTKCTGKKHLEKQLKKVLDLGGEGLMIRQPKSKYERTRSRTLLKIKKFHDAEARVIGHEPGKGRNQHCTGALRCEMANGHQFSVGSGLTDADRRKPPKIGSIITYKFQEYTNSGTPRFPTFLGIRIDMTEPKDAELPPKPTDD